MELTHFVIALAGILMPIALLAIIFGYTNKSENRFHETAQKLIESGQALDEETLSGIPGYQKKFPRNDVRSGLITTGVGLGVTLLGWIALGSVITGAGLLVLCIGGAIFAYGYTTKNNKLDSTD